MFSYRPTPNTVQHKRSVTTDWSHAIVQHVEPVQATVRSQGVADMSSVFMQRFNNTTANRHTECGVYVHQSMPARSHGGMGTHLTPQTGQICFLSPLPPPKNLLQACPQKVWLATCLVDTDSCRDKLSQVGRYETNPHIVPKQTAGWCDVHVWQ